MPRQAGTKIQNKFIRGLITEATVLSFPEDACTSQDNCVFDHTGKVTRRPGFDTEEGYTTDSISVVDGNAYVTYVWKAVSGNGTISFQVTQAGDTLYFHDISSSTILSTNKHATEISLDTYLATDSTRDPANFECQFADGNGDLFVVNPACDPFYISYNAVDNTFTATQITVKVRDFEGLEDELDADERITSSVTAAETSNPNHLYNLYNQGWAGTDALSQWDTARSDLPSNVDYIALYRGSETDAFDNSRVTAQDPGNRLAPRGHFILDAFTLDRQTAQTEAGFSFALEFDTNTLISSSDGSVYSDFSYGQSFAFDDVTDSDTDELTAYVEDVTSAYLGKNFGSSDTKSINKVVLYPLTQSSVGFLENDNFNLVITLYGNNSTPASATDGTTLGSETLTSDQVTALTIPSNDTTTTYQYLWCNFVPDSTDTIFVDEMQFFSGTATFERFSCVAFYAGRVFYGGVVEDGLSSNIYFSQVIEDESQYGKCYQKNDPTSEEFPDLLPDDGGVIKIPEMGTLKKLYAYQNALIAFASNGVWLIQGAAGSTFKASEYQVKKISSIGMDSPQSLLSLRGLPAWWGEDGIYTVQFDPNYDSFTPQSLTFQTIDTFYQSLSLENKRYVKGAYDEIEQIAYWLYSSDTLGTDKYIYDSVLCFDARTQAFYTWSISAGPTVRSIDFIQAADRSETSRIKYMIHQTYNGSTATNTFADVTNTNYIDWQNEGTSANYDSYFVTGYSLDGQTQRFFQPNYVFVFLDQETNASCFMQTIFDTATGVGTGKWSTRQQIYNENLLNRQLNFRRLKVKGKGRTMQMRFESEDQKPFTILGWSIWETVNANL